MQWDLEELARLALEEADIGAPVDPDILAFELGFTVHDGGPGCEGLLVGTMIFVDDTIRPERRAFAIAHELGHALLQRAGLRDSEWGANYIASALLLPKLDIERSWRRFGWDLIRLRAEHRFASFEAHARRLVALRGARASVFDRPLRGQGEERIYTIPYTHAPTDDELLAIREALAFGAPVEPVAGVTAWPVLEHHWHRVVTVCANSHD